MPFDQLHRRQFIALLGGAAAAWPLAARAQQPERVRRVGALMSLTADDPETPARIAAFAQGLADLGWTIGRKPTVVDPHVVTGGPAQLLQPLRERGDAVRRFRIVGG